MAISPGMILVPSNLIIQKEKIPGYNNVLTQATDKMKFGKNTGVNYRAPIVTTTQANAKVNANASPKLKTQVNLKTIQVNPKTITSKQTKNTKCKCCI